MKRALALVFAGSLLVAGCKGNGGSDKSAKPGDGDNAASAGKTTHGSDNGASAAVPGSIDRGPKKPLPADTGKHAGAHRWSLRLGGTSRESARDIARAPSGELFVGGLMGSKETESTATIAGSKLEADGVDAVIARLDATGKPQWARNFGGPGDDMIEAIAATADGGVAVGGSFAETLSFADTGVPAVGADDGFVAKFTGDGRRLWAKRLGGEDVDSVYAMASDKDGNVYASGVFRRRASFGDTELESSGGADAFVFSLDASGNYRWVKQLGAESTDYGRTLAVAPDGSLYWLVEFSRAVTVDGVVVESVGNRDWAVFKLSPAGKAQWAVAFGGLMDELAYRLVIDPAGDLIIAGSFDEALELGATKLVSAGEADAFVAKLDGRDGKVLWARSWGDKRADIAAAVATDRFGNVAVSGMYWNAVDFGGGELRSRGEKDIFVVKLSPTGDHLWSKNFGGEQVDYARDLEFDDDGNLLMAGTFYLTANFGGVDLTADSTGQKVPTGDMFVAKLGR